MLVAEKYARLTDALGTSDRAPVEDAIDEIVKGQRYLERSAFKEDIEFMLDEYEGDELKVKVSEYFEDVDKY